RFLGASASTDPGERNFEHGLGQQRQQFRELFYSPAGSSGEHRDGKLVEEKEEASPASVLKGTTKTRPAAARECGGHLFLRNKVVVECILVREDVSRYASAAELDLERRRIADCFLFHAWLLCPRIWLGTDRRPGHRPGERHARTFSQNHYLPAYHPDARNFLVGHQCHHADVRFGHPAPEFCRNRFPAGIRRRNRAVAGKHAAERPGARRGTRLDLRPDTAT